MTPKMKSVVLGLAMVLGGLGAVFLALLVALPVAVNLPESWFGAMLAFLVASVGIGFMYHGGQRLWANTK
jgi:hypothetical protein